MNISKGTNVNTPLYPSPAPTVFRYGEGAEDWSSLLPSWQIICLCLAITLLVCWLRAHPGTLAYIKCIRGGPEGRWIAVQQDIENDEEDDEDEDDIETGNAERTRAISMKYRELRNEGYSTTEAMELAESIISLNPQPRNEHPKVKEDGSEDKNLIEKSVVDNNKYRSNKETTDTHKGSKKTLASASSPPASSSKLKEKDGKVVISGVRNDLKNAIKPKQVPQVLKVVEVAEDDQWYPGAYPKTRPLHMKKLQKEEKKLQRYRMLQKEGYEDAQARFLAGLPREDNEEEFLWSEVQDEINNVTYYWDGDSVTTFKKPFENIWRVFVVFKPSSKMIEHNAKRGKAAANEHLRKGEIAAKEFEFGKGNWVDLGVVGLPPRPPAKAESPKKAKVSNLAEKSKPAPSINNLGKSSSLKDRLSIFAGRGGSLPRQSKQEEAVMLGEEEEEDAFEERVNIKGLGGSGKKKEDMSRNAISSPRY